LTTATLLVELRLVYRWKPGERDVSSKPPRQLYLIFPVPANADAMEYQRSVMRSLYEAVSAIYGTNPTLPRGGTPTDGFSFSVGGKAVRITKPMVRSLAATFRSVDVQVF
jgi:hypothetical protein